VLAGGAEAAMTPVALAAFGNMTHCRRAGSRGRSTCAGTALSSPRVGRSRARGARAREGSGAHIYAELLGGASTADAHHITAPAPGGAGAIGCMELALEDAGLTAGDIAHVNAHGTSTP